MLAFIQQQNMSFQLQGIRALAYMLLSLDQMLLISPELSQKATNNETSFYRNTSSEINM